MKAHKDYPSMIATSKTGYLSGFEVVSENEQAKENIDKFLKVNTFEAVHNNLVGATCSYGAKAIRLYTDSLTGLTTFSDFEPWSYAPFYDKTGRLVAVMQWEETTKEVRENYQVGLYKVTYLNNNEDMYFYTNTNNSVLIPNSQEYPRTIVSDIEISDGRRPHTYNVIIGVNH